MTSTRRRSIFKARRFYLVDCDCLSVEGTSGPLQDQGLLVPPRKAVAGGRLKPNSITEPSVGVRSRPTTVLIGVPRVARAGWHALAEVSGAWQCPTYKTSITEDQLRNAPEFSRQDDALLSGHEQDELIAYYRAMLE